MALSETAAEQSRVGGPQYAMFAWGLNHKGQLGIGNKEDQNEPARIQNAKEKFIKVVCGQNFSMGLTV